MARRSTLLFAAALAGVGLLYVFARRKEVASQPMVGAMAAPTVSAPLPETVTTPVPSYQALYTSQVHTVTG